jgi:hypothetical protein
MRFWRYQFSKRLGVVDGNSRLKSTIGILAWRRRVSGFISSKDCAQIRSARRGAALDRHLLILSTSRDHW